MTIDACNVTLSYLHVSPPPSGYLLVFYILFLVVVYNKVLFCQNLLYILDRMVPQVFSLFSNSVMILELFSLHNDLWKLIFELCVVLIYINVYEKLHFTCISIHKYHTFSFFQ
jgi:hypothetical protein